MRIFDTYVQKLKYKVLTELARQTWVGNDAFRCSMISQTRWSRRAEPTMSCCIYKTELSWRRGSVSHWAARRRIIM